MRFDVILALTDLSSRENMAVQRACLLAAGHGARVRLMHVPSRRQPFVAGAASRLALLAHRFEQALHVPVDCVAQCGATPADVAEAAHEADLVVVCERRGRGLRDLLAGGPTVRLLRTVARPVLIVRCSPLANYLRVLAGVDLGSASEALARFARAVQPHATLELFHAISSIGEARLRLAGASERAIRLYRRHCVERTEGRLGLLRAGVQSPDNRVEIGLGAGDTARALLARQQRATADLIILGRRHRTAWSEFFARSTTRDLLAWGRCDLLSVPDDGYRFEASPWIQARKASTGGLRAWRAG